MCHILCSSGKGGALCDCGDMPPAFEAIPKEKARSPSPECYQAKEIPCTPTNCDAPRDSLEGFCCNSCRNGWGMDECDCGKPPPAPEAVPKEKVEPTSGMGSCCEYFCSIGVDVPICDCTDSPPPVFQAANNQNSEISDLYSESHNSTILKDIPQECCCSVFCPGGNSACNCDDCAVAPPSQVSNIDPPDCTVLCSTGDGGAACDCHNIPPGIAPIDFQDTDPVDPSPSEPNCTVLCKTGDGGAACGT